jgi:hypothetical protein
VKRLEKNGYRMRKKRRYKTREGRTKKDDEGSKIEIHYVYGSTQRRDKTYK